MHYSWKMFGSSKRSRNRYLYCTNYSSKTIEKEEKYMGKVTYEFDENKESRDIKLIVNRYKMIYALDELEKYRHDLSPICPRSSI